MKKIPTLFVRDWNGDRGLVLNQVNPECSWVANGEGIATQKYDGTCCMMRDGILYKRHETKKTPPSGFDEIDFDHTTGKHVGWLPVGNGPEDKWHREALTCGTLPDGTYELLGPKVQGNPEMTDRHILLNHKMAVTFPDAPRDFIGLKEWLSYRDIEGLVWHHPDGRMAKIKKRDFGLSRK